MDYLAKYNLMRVKLKNDSLFWEYSNFLEKNTKKVKTFYYLQQQSRCLAVAFIEEKGLPHELFSVLKEIADCYYKLTI